MGTVVKKVLASFPSLSLAATIQPITRTVLRVRLTITPDFDWEDKFHGSSAEPWWLWVEDAENNTMYHSEYFLLQKKQVELNDTDTILCAWIFCVHVYTVSNLDTLNSINRTAGTLLIWTP